MNTNSQRPREAKTPSLWSNVRRGALGFPQFFDRFHWKLTLSYTLVSVVVVVVLAVLALAGFLWFYSQFFYANIPARMAQEAAIIAPYFSDERNLQENISTWLAAQKRFTVGSGLDGEAVDFDLVLSDTIRLHVFDPQKRLLASSPSSPSGTNELELNRTEEAILDGIFAGEGGRSVSLTRQFPFRLFITTPIVLDGRVAGSLVVTEDFGLIKDGLSVLGVSLFIIILLAMVVGTGFGYISSRALIRRLKHVEEATVAWRQGDFEGRIRDPSWDELGRLTVRLNHMAEDLASHISTRQELATLEERNRLALELHDNIKQQVFALGMKVGFAESLADNAALKTALSDIGELAHQTQDELQRLIHELKPVALENESLQAALETHISAWEALHGIKVNHQIDLRKNLPGAVEQAFFRIVQESLANVAKHSGARRVNLTLRQSDVAVELTVQDDGCGFNPEEVTSGFGRRSMLERMRRLGGSLDIRTEAGKGTRVEALLPLGKG